jgi:hypothetical protein
LPPSAEKPSYLYHIPQSADTLIDVTSMTSC